VSIVVVFLGAGYSWLWLQTLPDVLIYGIDKTQL